MIKDDLLISPAFRGRFYGEGFKRKILSAREV